MPDDEIFTETREFKFDLLKASGISLSKSGVKISYRKTKKI